MTFPVPVSVTIHYSPMDTAVITDTLLLALYRQEGDVWVKNEDTCSVTRRRFLLKRVSFRLPSVRAVAMPCSDQPTR